MDTKKNNQCTSHGEDQYTKKIMMKSNYKNTQNKWQEDYANWFIELIKKIFFSRNFKGIY